MIRKILSAAVATAAIAVAGPALAGPGGGGGGGGGHGGMGGGGAAGAHGGMGGGLGAGMGGVLDRGGMSGGMGAGVGADINGNATRINSHASANSSFNRTTTSGRTTVQSSALPGLATGLTVQTSTGTTLGTVSRILTDRNGNILGVLVTTSTGRTLRLSPTTLSMNGTTLVTTVTNTFANPAIGVSQGPLHASATGIAHANSHSVLAGGSVAGTALTGLTTNMQVLNSNGTNIGTVSRVVTDSNGNVRLVIVTNSTTGRTFRLAPSTLRINGSIVTTTSPIGG